MKKRNKFIFLATLSTACLLSLASCQGAQGPKGDQGTPGINGINGTDGKNGTDGQDGKSVLSGKGVPASSLGSDGDSYIDTETFDFYVKASGVWAKEGNIKGASGDKGDAGDSGSKGEDGTSVRTGKGEPSESLGNDGDSYIDLSNFDFYVKEDGKWSKEGNIKGEKGEKGDKGENGSNGSSGKPGNDGTPGKTAWSNTILPTTGGYITVDAGSAFENTTVNFSFIPNTGWHLVSYSFGSDTTSLNSNETYTISKTMQAGGFVVAAKFAEGNIQLKNGDIGNVTGEVEVGESTTNKVSFTPESNVTITKGTMTGSGSGESTPDLEINGSEKESTVTIAKDVNISNYNLNLGKNVTLVIEEGANVTFNNVTLNGNSKIQGSYKKASSVDLLSTLAVDDEDAISYDITGLVTITGKATLENVAIKGKIEVNTTDEFVMKDCYYKADGLSTNNAYLLIKSKNVTITDNEFNLNNAVYNFLEWPSGDEANKIQTVKITGNTFDCKGMTHNVINMFNFVNNASIDLTNNTYKNVNYKGTQPVRISNYKNAATGVTIDVSNSVITNATKGEDEAYDTFVLFQDYAGANDTAQDFSSFTLVAKGDYFDNLDKSLVKYNYGEYYKDLLVVYSKYHANEVKMPKVTLTSGSYDTTKVLFGGGRGTEADPYLISSLDDWKNISNFDGKDVYFKQTADITIDSSLATFAGHYDGDNKTISYLKDSGTCYFAINKIDGDASFKNINLKMGKVGVSLLGTVNWDTAYNASFENITFSSDADLVEVNNNNFGLIVTNCLWSSQNANVSYSFKNITNNIKHLRNDGTCIGFLTGYSAYIKGDGTASFTLENCTNNGIISGAGQVGFVYGNTSGFYDNDCTGTTSYSVKDCKNGTNGHFYTSSGGLCDFAPFKSSETKELPDGLKTVNSSFTSGFDVLNVNDADKVFVNQNNDLTFTKAKTTNKYKYKLGFVVPSEYMTRDDSEWKDGQSPEETNKSYWYVRNGLKYFTELKELGEGESLESTSVKEFTALDPVRAENQGLTVTFEEGETYKLVKSESEEKYYIVINVGKNYYINCEVTLRVFVENEYECIASTYDL